jgi:hypothetical protein
MVECNKAPEDNSGVIDRNLTGAGARAQRMNTSACGNQPMMSRWL